MAGTIHIVFGEAGGNALRHALRLLDSADHLLEFPDELSFGPIAPSDPALRAKWVAEQLGEPEWREIVPHVEAFWAAALSGAARHVVWFSRRVTREYTGFLDYLWHVGDRPSDVVDLTETLVPAHGPDGAIKGMRRVLATGLIDAYQILDGNLFAQAIPLSDEARRRDRAQWQALRSENAPLRVVTPDLRLVSAPLTHFDAALFKQMEHRFRKSARIIGHVMMEQSDKDIIDVEDFFLSRRLLMLARAGVIESRGDLKHIRFSEVRLPRSVPDV